jgi:hypothetical protein
VEANQKRVDVRQPDLDIVRALASEFEVSFQAAAIRFVKLTPERCCVVFSKDGRVSWTAMGPDFAHWILPGEQLDPYTLAYDYFYKERDPNRRESVSSAAWFSDDQPSDEDTEVFEDCLVIPSLRSTLSLFWIPGDPEPRGEA